MSLNNKVNELPEEKKEEIVQNEENEEENKVDVELQEQMKKAKIDDSAFNKEGAQQKSKKEENKKNKKSKGQDFIDYANKNNIAINIEYEQDKFTGKTKKTYDNKKPYEQRDQNCEYKKDNYHYQNQHQDQQSYHQNHQQHRGKYNNYQNDYEKNSKRTQVKFGKNKFDTCNQQNAFDSMQIQQQHQQYHHHPNEHHYAPKRSGPKLTEDKEIFGFIENLFSLENLNKDLYIRFRLNDKGRIDIKEISEHFTLKNNNISSEKIMELLQSFQSSFIQISEEKTFVEIKNYEQILPQLMSTENIYAQKKQFKMQKMQEQSYGQMPYPYNMPMPNNYYPGYQYQYYPGQNFQQPFMNTKEDSK